MAYDFNLATGARAERKALITIADWAEGSGSSITHHAVILGKRVEDSSVEFNADTQQTTDILGINYTDLNKTQPQQTFDPSYIIGGDELMKYLTMNALKNNISAFNGTFDVYVVAAYITETTTGSTAATTKYYTVKHSNCSIIPTSLGGDAYVAMPFDVYFSNDITEGYVESIAATDLLDISTNFKTE